MIRHQLQEDLPDLLRVSHTADRRMFLHLVSGKSPGGEADLLTVSHAKLSGDDLCRLVVCGISDDLISRAVAQTDRAWRIAAKVGQRRIQLGNRSAVSIRIHESNSFCRIFVGEDGNHHRNEGIEAAHFARVQVFYRLSFRSKASLESLESIDCIGAELPFQHGDGTAETCYHGRIVIFLQFIQRKQFQFDGLALLFQFFQHIQPEGQGTAAASAQECGTVQNLQNILFI